MGLVRDGETWAATVALKKIVAAILGFLASQKVIAGIAWLQAHGVNVSIDTYKFQEQFTLLGIAGFAALHDWLKLKYPESKWL